MNKAQDLKSREGIVDKVTPLLVGESFVDIAASLLAMTITAAQQAGISKMELQYRMVKVWDAMEADPICQEASKAMKGNEWTKE